jgi:hypothetical protein
MLVRQLTSTAFVAERHQEATSSPLFPALSPPPPSPSPSLPPPSIYLSALTLGFPISRYLMLGDRSHLFDAKAGAIPHF